MKKSENSFKINKADKVFIKRSGKVKEGTSLIRKKGKTYKATSDGKVSLRKGELIFEGAKVQEEEYKISPDDEVLVKDKETVVKGQLITVGSVNPSELMGLNGLDEAQKYIIDNIQETYGLQGISLDDKHVEIIVRKMSSFVTITYPGDSPDRLPGEYANFYEVIAENAKLKELNKEQVKFTRKLLGITAASINTESFLSAASFQEVVRVLSDGALVGKEDRLRGLKENVIIGRPVPLGKYLR